MEKKEDRFFLIGAFCIFLLFTCKNYHPSMVNLNTEDMIQYIDFYMENPDSMYGIPLGKDSEIEPGLGIICKVLGFFPRSPFFFVFVMRLICLLPIFYGIRKYSTYKNASLFFFFALPGIALVEMITLRQALATSFLILAVTAYLERPRRWGLWAAAFMVCSVFSHRTSFLVAAFVLGVLALPFRKYLYMGVLLVSGAVAGVFARILAGAFASVFSSIAAMDQITDYVTKDIYSMGSESPLLFLGLAVIGAFIVWFCDEKDSRHVFFVKNMALGIIIYNLLGRYPLVDRMTAPLMLIGAMGALPKKTRDGSTPFYRKLSWWGLLLCMLFLFVKDYKVFAPGNSPLQPYHFILEKPLLWMFPSL
ncbi:MAG: EpsG family protein [Bacteroidales bacterium]|nr:EpsG family protein [Bacteroidales bacterium]